jgi:hypothetical protein
MLKSARKELAIYYNLLTLKQLIISRIVMSIGIKSAKRNWSKYNNALVNRGYLTLFVSKDFAENWYVKYDKNTLRTRGGQASMLRL